MFTNSHSLKNLKGFPEKKKTIQIITFDNADGENPKFNP